jgi:hypothetical protein
VIPSINALKQLGQPAVEPLVGCLTPQKGLPFIIADLLGLFSYKFGKYKLCKFYNINFPYFFTIPNSNGERVHKTMVSFKSKSYGYGHTFAMQLTTHAKSHV